MSQPSWKQQEWNKGINGYHSPSIIKEEGMYPYLLGESFRDFYDNKNILDLGCGPGHIAKLICENFEPQSYTAIDYSQSFIDYARNLDFNSKCMADFIIGDVRDLKPQVGNFDTVICLNVIPIFHNQEDLNKLFSTIQSLLKPASKLVLMNTYDKCILSGIFNENFQVALVDSESEPIKYHLKVKNIDGEFFEFDDNCWSTDIIKNKIKEIGLRLIGTHEIGNSKSFPDYYPFISFIAKSNA